MRAAGILVLLFIAGGVSAQTPDAPPRSLAEAAPRRFDGEAAPVRLAAVDLARRQARGAAFPIELAGATAGSLAGLGLGMLVASPDDCDNEDLACILRSIGVVGVFTIAGAPAGAMLLGDWADTRPSLAGAAIGSLLGAAAGAGLLRLTEEVDDDPFPILYSVIVYTGAHGLLTAVGSRLGALIRD